MALLSGCSAGPTPAPPRFLFEDFETGQARWKDAGSGSVRTTVTLVEGGVGGDRAAQVQIRSAGPGEGWSDLTWPIEAWPAGATHLVAWVRAPRPCRIAIKVNLGPGHEDLEMWGRTIEVGTEWREVRIEIGDLDEFLWGHKRSAAPDPARILGIGFVERGLPALFEVDRIGAD